MDRFIASFQAREDGDLMLCEGNGVAYQRDMSIRIDYDDKYFAQFQSYAGSQIELSLNAGRCALLGRHLPTGARVLDIGIGSGAFLKAAIAMGFDARGYDINPLAVTWLKAEKLYADDANEFEAVTMWDSLEHIEEPAAWLLDIRKGAYLFAAIPVFDDLTRIRESRHFKPGEHLTYWEAKGFIDWLGAYGFRLLETSTHETDAGRESIGAFAFVRA